MIDQHHTFIQWLNHHWAVISLIYFPAAMMYLNSLAIFLKVMGATKLADFLAKLEEALIAARDAAKAYKQQTAKTVPLILICLGLIFSVGCTVLKSGCGHINGAEVTVPYVGGKANGNAYGCYMGCIGINCKTPDYDSLANITTEYIKDASKDNAITTSSAGTITFTPVAK